MLKKEEMKNDFKVQTNSCLVIVCCVLFFHFKEGKEKKKYI